MVTEKIIDKLRKLRAHAESAEKIGSINEAEAFAAMFQQLLMRHNLELNDVEFEEEQKDEPIERETINWQEYNDPLINYGAKRVAWLESLAVVVTRAFFCRILVRSGSSRITIVGTRSNVEVATYMFITLARSAEKLVRSEYRAYKKENPEGGKGFRVSFLSAFVERLSQRFYEERKTAETSSSTALVRLNRAESAVVEWMQKFAGRASGIGGGRDYENAEGRRRGRAVADSLNLKSNAVRGGAPRGQLT